MARLARNGMTEYLDRAMPCDAKPSDQRKQRVLASPIQAEQGGEAGRWHTQAHVTQRLARAVRVANIMLALRFDSCWHTRSRSHHKIGGRFHCGDTTTPQGS